jgi:hypothetical protein
VHENAIEQQGVDMNMEVEGTAHSLNGEDGAGVYARLAELLRLGSLEAKHLAVNDGDDGAKNV